MREELQNYDWHTYGLRLEDIDYTLSLVKNALEERREVVCNQRSVLEKQNPECADDIMDDVSYYSYD